MEERKDGNAAGSKPKSLTLEKMETLVRQMQSPDAGVPVRCQKLFLTTIPSAFMGYDLIEWLMENLPIDDSEALHLATLLCQHGYFFPVGEAKTLVVKDDSSLYRFQTPYYWPSQNHVPDSTDYAIYLHKKVSKNKQKHGLEDCELDAYNQLKKQLASKWDFVSMQADEQLKMAKDRKKGDKIVSESQERAYWRVYRPPPGFTNPLENPPVPDKGKPQMTACSSDTLLKKECDFLNLCMTRLRIKISQVAESMLTHYDTYLELDPFLSPVQPSNPWLTDDATFMELNEPLVEFPTERRIRRWAISMEETVTDPTGLHEFTTCMQKEFSHENIRFWSAVHQLKKMPLSQVEKEVNNIYDEFLRPGAPCEINIDSKTMERTQELMNHPSRFTFDLAAEHIYDLLLKKDCYPRFLRSEHYKNLLLNATNPTSKKKFFTFGATGKKKISSATPPNINQLGISSGRSASDEAPSTASINTATTAATTAAATASNKSDSDQPYRGDVWARDRAPALLKDADAGIFLGGPTSPPVCARPALSPASSVTSTTQRPAKQTDFPTAGASGASSLATAIAPSLSTVAAAASIIGSVAITTPPPSPTDSALGSRASTVESMVYAKSSSVDAGSALAVESRSVAEVRTRKISVTEPPNITMTDTGQLIVADAASPSKKVETYSPARKIDGSPKLVRQNSTELPPAPSDESFPPLVESVGDNDANEPVLPSGNELAEATPPPSEFAPQVETDRPVSDPPVGFNDFSVEIVQSKTQSAEDIEFELSASALNYEQPQAEGFFQQDVSSSRQVMEEAAIAVDGATASAALSAVRSAILASPLQLTPPSAGETPPWEQTQATIAPPAGFQDLGGPISAPLATIDESMEERASLCSPLPIPSGSHQASPKLSRTTIVTLTDSCAQTIETGDAGDYGSVTDKQCEANLAREGSACSGRGTRRKEKRVKISDLPPQTSSGEAKEKPGEEDTTATPSITAEAAAASSGTQSESGECGSRPRRRSRSGSAEGKKERRESRSKRDRDTTKKKAAGTDKRRSAKHEEAGSSEVTTASPKRGDVVAPAAAEPAPQTLDDSSVCPWENEEACKLDTPFVKTYATLGYL